MRRRRSRPDLTYLINWGYGNPAYGYSTGPANVPTPFGFLPPLGATTALGHDLVVGPQQGILAAANDFHAEGPTSLTLPASVLPEALKSVPSLLAAPAPQAPTSAIDNFIQAIEAANDNIAGGFATDLSTGYATLLPTADIATAIAFSLPSYDVNLALHGVSQMLNGQPVVGLMNAIGDPIAADVRLVMLAGGFELIVAGYALDTIVFGTPHPLP